MSWPADRPTGNAVAERTFQTAEVQCLWLSGFADEADVQSTIEVWRQTFTHERPHEALGWQTQTEQRAERLASPR